MCAWHKTVDIRTNKVDTQLQQKAFNQGWIQQDITERTDIKL